MFVWVCVCVSIVIYYFDRKANLCDCKYVLMDIGHPMKHGDPFSSATLRKILPNFQFIEFVNHFCELLLLLGLVPAETPDWCVDYFGYE